jgi:transposase
MQTAPQIAVVNDSTHYKIKRANVICRLYRQFYNETITMDVMAAKIASESKLGLSANSIKTLLSEYRRHGWQAPKLARKPRTVNGATSEVNLSFDEINAQWGK